MSLRILSIRSRNPHQGPWSIRSDRLSSSSAWLPTPHLQVVTTQFHHRSSLLPLRKMHLGRSAVSSLQPAVLMCLSTTCFEGTEPSITFPHTSLSPSATAVHLLNNHPGFPLG